ncbi:MAG: trigger factor, partial [Thiomargarita sp.]|nr:trigger factor [Thiomargarita sp.]
EHQSINGNRLIVNIVGTINGNPFKNNNLKKIPVILGENDFIFPEFEEKLLGMGIEENREFDITFSKEHHNVEIAGQTVHFMVHVSKIETAQLPEMNEDFIRSFGVTDGRMETLRIEARKNMERELQYVNNKTIKQQILNALLQENPITEIPVSLMKAETERLLKKTSQDKYIQAVDTKNIQDTAERLIKIGLLAGEVIGKHNIKATPQKIYQMVANIAHAYENSEAVIQEYYTDQKRLKDIETSVIEDELVNWLLQRANITEKHTDFYTAVTT